MNGKQAKAIRRRAKESMVEWYKSQLPEEEHEKVTPELVMEQIPQDKHISMRTSRHSAFSYKWFVKAEKLKYYYG